MSAATLRVLDRADNEIGRLPRNIRRAVVDFMHKFRLDTTAPGLHVTSLRDRGGGERLYSGHVTEHYRALLLHLDAHEYLLVSVKHRTDAYTGLDRISYGINDITGGIEYVDLGTVESRINQAATAQPASEQQPQQAQQPALDQRAAPDHQPQPPTDSGPQPLFAHVSDQQLTELGAARVLLPSIREIRTEPELDALVDTVPQLTGEVLRELHDGWGVDTVLEYITRPVVAEDEIDPTDYQAALARPATLASSDDPAVQSALGEGFAAWQVFLHPTQRKLVERDYNGPARVSGGPGTGKTIVALHRVKHLVDTTPGRGKPVLLTTFTRNLASDLRNRLRDLGGQELLDRVEVLHVDAVVAKVLHDHGAIENRLLKDWEVPKEWAALLSELGETRWSPEFLAEEWNEVILGQVINSRNEYFRARRPGRGQLRRPDRDAIWQLVERFTKRLDDRKVTTFRQRAERAARLEMARDAQIQQKSAEEERHGGANLHREAGSGAFLKHRYRHVVVDEAQDLNPAHWKLLRAMVATSRNDMFIVGDTHQRIYENSTSLGSLGVNIRGRSSRLTLSYRTTRQILRSALGLLSGEVYDDLDGGTDHLNGYRAILTGAAPQVVGCDTWEQEKAAVVEQVRTWHNSEEELSSIGVAAPTRDMVEELTHELNRSRLRAVEIGREGPDTSEAVRVGTMHRCKGLEFQHMCVAGVSDGLVPRPQRAESTQRAERQRQRERSLLFVASTRARDTLVITHHGEPSRFLYPLIATQAG